ncbi:MAG: adenylate/guanylate cyclase domain-containing protein [Vicinamibacterales bacterium]
MGKATAAGLLGLGAALIVLIGAAGGVFDTWELKAYDWRTRVTADPASIDPDIVFVEINDLSIRDLAPAIGRWPWPRAVVAALIEFISRGPAKVIAVDLALLEPDTVTHDIGGQPLKGSDSDQALADAVKRAGNVVMLADAVYGGAIEGNADATATWPETGYRVGERIEQRPVIVPPYQSLKNAARGIAHNFLALDEDGPARRVPPFVRRGDKYVPSLGVAAAIAALGIGPDEVRIEGSFLVLRDRWIPLIASTVVDDKKTNRTHTQLAMMIPYRAPALVDNRRPFPSYEARHLVIGNDQIIAGAKPDLDPAVFKNKIVFIGFTASGLVDIFQTPFGSEGTMPGIQLHASVADGVLSNRFIQPAPERSRIASIGAAAILVSVLTVFAPFTLAAVAALVAAAGWTWVSSRTFGSGTWINMVQPLAAMGLSLFAGTAYRYFVEDREKRKVSRLFGRYVSRDVYAQLIDNPALAELGGKRREMSVLFSDIRGFTTVTERGNPEELVAQLNEYFSRMVEIVFHHHGTVDKFVGDMVMALFGAPVDDSAHAEHAVAAAVDMVKELGELNRKWTAEGKPPLDIGVGVNTGDMIAGNIGSSSIMSYTVIGDNVNLGSRLESLNKEYGTRIIISDATKRRLTGHYDVRPLGDVVVKGKTKSIVIYEIRVPAPVS